MNRFSRSLAVALALLGAVLLSEAGMAATETLIVQVDRAKILRLPQPASTIILGNPAIADALVHDERMLVVTGKSFGATNLIVLDPQGEMVEEMLLQVRAADDGVLTVQKGSARVSFSCAPVCQRTLVVGDTSESYDLLNAQIQNSITLSEGQAAQ